MQVCEMVWGCLVMLLGPIWERGGGRFPASDEVFAVKWWLKS